MLLEVVSFNAMSLRKEFTFVEIHSRTFSYRRFGFLVVLGRVGRSK